MTMEIFMKYGIDSNLAEILHSSGLTISTIKNTSVKNLIDRYELSEFQASNVKRAVSRKAVKQEILDQLLQNSAFTCCICQGHKSDAYIIHHIDHYNKSQDNSYDNLAVPCVGAKWKLPKAT